MPTLAELPDRCEEAIERSARSPEPSAAQIDALARSARGARSLARRLASIGDQARRLVGGDGLRLPLRPRAAAALDRLPDRRRHARPELLRPAGLRGAARELRRDRQGRRAGAALVPPRARAHAGRSRLGADLVVGIDVRVPDAVAGDARAGGEPARADQPPGRATAPEVRRRARRALGRLRVGLQRARSRAHLPVLQLRRARPRLEARARRRRGHRALRDGARGDGGSGSRRAELRASRRRRRPRPLRLVRGARLHAVATARGRAGRDRARLHGAPPGHDRGRDRQRAPRRRDARPLPRRADDPGDRAAAPGADAARCRRRAPARRGGAGGRERARAGASDAAPLRFAARSDPARASALERPLRRDGHRGRLGLQPLAGPRRDALARGRDLRCVRARTCSCAMRRAARCGRPATSRAASSRTPTRWSSPRIASRSPAATAPSRRRSRSRSPPRTTPRCDAYRSRTSGARVREIELTSYAEIVLAPPAADAAHPAFSKLFVQTEFVPEIGALLATRRRRSPGEPEVFAAHLAVVEGERVGAAALRDRPRALPRPRADAARGALGDGRPAALGHRRRGARSDLQPALPRADPARRHRARGVLDAGRAVARRGARPGRQAPRPDGVRARGHAGVDAGAGRSCITSVSVRTRRTSSSASPTTCSSPIRRCGPPPPCSSATSRDPRRSGPMGSPATCRSSWSASTKPTTSRCSGSCCALTSTGG